MSQVFSRFFYAPVAEHRQNTIIHCFYELFHLTKLCHQIIMDAASSQMGSPYLISASSTREPGATAGPHFLGGGSDFDDAEACQFASFNHVISGLNESGQSRSGWARRPRATDASRQRLARVSPVPLAHTAKRACWSLAKGLTNDGTVGGVAAGEAGSPSVALPTPVQLEGVEGEPGSGEGRQKELGRPHGPQPLPQAPSLQSDCVTLGSKKQIVTLAVLRRVASAEFPGQGSILTRMNLQGSLCTTIREFERRRRPVESKRQG